jgi:hypothetical protein
MPKPAGSCSRKKIVHGRVVPVLDASGRDLDQGHGQGRDRDRGEIHWPHGFRQGERGGEGGAERVRPKGAGPSADRSRELLSGLSNLVVVSLSLQRRLWGRFVVCKSFIVLNTSYDSFGHPGSASDPPLLELLKVD